jgi:DNA-binding CsgD family transcriptional regulator
MQAPAGSACGTFRFGAFGAMASKGEGARHGDLLRRLAEETDLQRALRHICAQFAFKDAVYQLAQHSILPIDSPFVRTTYKAEWVLRYVLNRYLEIDPVIVRGFRATRPFFWDELDFSDERAKSFLEDSRRNGVANCGYCIPIVDPRGLRALFTVSADDDEADWRGRIIHDAATLEEIASILHRKALAEMRITEDRPPLSPREIECLNWTARGKDAASIAVILQISEYTVRDYLKSARKKLECSSIAQAIYEATRLGLITPQQE